MKRFWLFLLILGLIAAFSIQAMAVDVKVSGEYYAAGLYLDKTTLVKDSSATYTAYTRTALSTPVVTPFGTAYYNWVPSTRAYTSNLSTAFYYQRLRLNTTFTVSPGLMLVTRADIMERAWGANRATPGTTADTLSAGTTAENQNIAFDLAYVRYTSPIGVVAVGYQIDGAWGTVFGDSSNPTPRLTYFLPIGNFQISLMTGKATPGIVENSKSAVNPNEVTTDRDNNFYTVFLKYLWKSGEAGLLIKHFSFKADRNLVYSLPASPALGYLSPDVAFDNATWVTGAIPYVKAKVGPVAIQGEFAYAYGQKSFEGPVATQVARALFGDDQIEVRNISAWVDATADFGIAYVGGSLAYVSGDDPGSRSRLEGGLLTGGADWNPCLIMFNNDLTYWAGAPTGYNAASMGGVMTNAWFFQARAGVRPVEKLDIMASVSYANADKKPAGFLNNDYGYEVDLTATYKITNNLSYMLGAGYVFTGKYYKGTSDANAISDEYMVMNKLSLTF